MKFLGLALRGMLMGLAEVVPGISGGSIAYITGIYERLVDSLATVLPVSIRDARSNEHWTRARQSLAFLFLLGTGMVVGVAIGLVGVKQFHTNQPLLFWGLIFGLLIGVFVRLVIDTKVQQLASFGLLGLAAGYLLSFVPSLGDGSVLWPYALGGFVAFIAWLLPGISGSMMLLLLGLWLPVVNAVLGLELSKIFTFAAGLIAGLVVLPRVVSFLLNRYRECVVAVFCGLVASGVLRAWPWKDTTEKLVFPHQFDGEAEILLVVCMMVVGFVGVCSTFVYERMKRAS